MQLLLITGPAGVGKSTLCWEMSAQLAAIEAAHAVIESDELDRVYPRPDAEALSAFGPARRTSAASTLQRSGRHIERSGIRA